MVFFWQRLPLYAWLNACPNTIYKAFSFQSRRYTHLEFSSAAGFILFSWILLYWTLFKIFLSLFFCFTVGLLPVLKKDTISFTQTLLYVCVRVYWGSQSPPTSELLLRLRKATDPQPWYSGVGRDCCSWPAARSVLDSQVRARGFWETIKHVFWCGTVKFSLFRLWINSKRVNRRIEWGVSPASTSVIILPLSLMTHRLQLKFIFVDSMANIRSARSVPLYCFQPYAAEITLIWGLVMES